MSRWNCRTALKPLVVFAVLAVFILLYFQFFEPKGFERLKLHAPHAGIDIHPVSVLAVGDPFAFSLQRSRSALLAGGTPHFELTILPYVATFNRILMDSRDWQSAYHCVSFDVVWLEQLVREGALSRLSAQDFAQMGLSESDFTGLSLALNRSGGGLYGLPAQPHTELLWYRKDILAAGGESVPTTPAQLIQVARRLQDPSRNLHGVAWNAHRGQALGQTVVHLLGAFGAPLGQQDGSLRLDSDVALQVAFFLRELLSVSPPDILTMAWDQRVERFARGHAVFVYGWTARTPMVENDPLSTVQGKVGYALPPMAPGVAPSLPIGQWSLGVPANLQPEERQRSLQWLRSVYTAAQSQHWTQAGFGSLLFADFRLPAHLEHDTSANELNNLLSSIAASGFLNPDIRPFTPHWQSIAELLGTLFHDMLLGTISPEDAVARSQVGLSALLNSASSE